LCTRTFSITELGVANVLFSAPPPGINFAGAPDFISDKDAADPVLAAQEQFARAGYIVVSNARNHRMDAALMIFRERQCQIDRAYQSQQRRRGDGQQREKNRLRVKENGRAP
jgi:hypothetical protein